jgi:glycosyltransferase involved in cell wall biosynthesis
MSDRKKICIYSPWMMAIGGIETHLTNIATVLAQHGWTVDFCVKYSKMMPSTIACLKAAGVGYHPFPSLGFFKNLFLSKSLLYTNSQGNTSPIIWQYGRAGRRGLHHCHTACSQQERSSWTGRYIEFIRQGPPLVSCSKQTMANLKELNPQRRIQVLPYLTSASEEVDSASSQTAQRPVEGMLSFGFVGRLDRSKGIELIIAASKRKDLQGICWHIYGDGEEGASVAGAEGANLKWHGAFERGTPLSQVYGSLHALALPSLHVEGSPLCLIEALSFGKPWIASGQGGIRELACSPADHLIIDPREPEQFFTAAKVLEKRLRDGVVDSGRIQSFYRDEYSCRAVTGKWLRYMESLASK